MIVFRGKLFPQRLDRSFAVGVVVQLMEIKVATLARPAGLQMVPFLAAETDRGRSGSLHLQAAGADFDFCVLGM